MPKTGSFDNIYLQKVLSVYPRGLCFLFVYGTTTAARARFAIRTTYAFLTVFLRLIDVGGCTADYGNDDCQNKIIYRSHYFFTSAKALDFAPDFAILPPRIQSPVNTDAKARRKISPPINPPPNEPVTIRVPI